ncbi:MAG: MAPEG family protein [Stenotrophobium sp.]
MNQTIILYPMMALAGWTFAVLALMPYQRFKAAFRGQVTPDDFKFGESARVPPAVSIPNRNYMNLLELPVLFYVACLTFYATKNVDAVAFDLCWAYVALRVGHSLIHLAYNQVWHRMTVFALSNFVLVMVWLRLLLVLSR